MPIDIDVMTEFELIDLNHRIVARLRFLRQIDAHEAMLEFRIGERVTFHPDGRPPVTGMITRYNKKTVSIVTDDGHRWNVAVIDHGDADPLAFSSSSASPPKASSV